MVPPFFHPTTSFWRRWSGSWLKELPAAWMSSLCTSQRSSGSQDLMVGWHFWYVFILTPTETRQRAMKVWSGSESMQPLPRGGLSATPFWVFYPVGSCDSDLFFPPQWRWHCRASLQRAWRPSRSGDWWPSSVTGSSPSFFACWSVWLDRCSGWWKLFWRSGFSGWLRLTSMPRRTPRRSDWAAWCWCAFCWLCSLLALKSHVQWSSDWTCWRAGWRQWRRGKVNSDERG